MSIKAMSKDISSSITLALLVLSFHVAGQIAIQTIVFVECTGE